MGDLGVGIRRVLRSGGEHVNVSVMTMPDWALKVENMMSDTSNQDVKSGNVKVEMPLTLELLKVRNPTAVCKCLVSPHSVGWSPLRPHLPQETCGMKLMWLVQAAQKASL